MDPSLATLDTPEFTREQFRRMIDAGIFANGEHVELLHGRFVVVSPQGPPHSYVSTVLRDSLLAAFPGKVVREAKPLDCGRIEVPEPDLVVARGTAKDFEDRDPCASETILVVEVSHTTQAVDRMKAAIYAQAGAPVYWLVDLRARRLEVHVGPAGDRYRLVRVLEENDRVDLPESDVRLVVRELLPSR